MKFRCPNCANPIEILPNQPNGLETVDSLFCLSCKSRFSLSDDSQSTTLSMPNGFMVAHFEVRELLGEGSFGTVYKAWDTRLERLVALKIPRESNTSKSGLHQALKEARAASEIHHSNVVTVHEIGSFGDSWYIATEFIDGPSLGEALKSRKFSGRESAEMMIRLLRAAQVFHDHKVIHRDLKPGNVLLDSRNEPHIADFGLACRDRGPDISVTLDGRILGTPAYMPPEQARGDVQSISNRSDIYSLGVILYELLTGERPFRGTDSRTLLHRVLGEDPKQPRKIRRSVDIDLETVCLKAMEKDPARRYASAGEMADDLLRFLEGRPILARRVSLAERLRKWTFRNKTAAGGIAVAVMTLVIASIVIMMNSNKTHAAQPVRHHVQISARPSSGTVADPSQIRWAFAPLNESREPEDTEVIRAQGAALADVWLVPGEYLVVVEIPGLGFHEVHRTVPHNLNEALSGSTNPLRFTIRDESVVELVEIVVLRDDEMKEMRFVPGGNLQSGALGNPFMPVTQFQISDVWMDAKEVSYDDYVQVLPEPIEYANSSQLSKGSYPIVGVTWNMAMHFAESRGCRLPTEFEWEDAATNGGKTKFSWGDSEPPPDNWKLADTRLEGTDINQAGICGLFSSASELTYSVLTPYPGGRMPDTNRRETQFGYVIRGGPLDDKDLDSNGNWPGNPRTRQSTNSRDESSPRVGFRCVRSARPRFM